MSEFSGYTKTAMDAVKNEIAKVVVGQERLADMALTTLLSGGHALIEGAPGLAKTLWSRALAFALSIDFKRMQFTSDLMPSDILGTKIYDMKNSEFILRKGPLFTNLFLADEINRTPPKTQSALLEVMQERSITIDGQKNALSEPFIVIATQNPIEYEGAYPLPESLTDRFMMKISVAYPGVAAEKRVLMMHNGGFDVSKLEQAGVIPVCSAQDIARCKEEIKDVNVDESVINYIVSIVETTRRINAAAYGSSPRGAVALLLCSKSYAAMNGRGFVVPDDVKEVAMPALRHRVALKPEAEMDGVNADQVIEDILSKVKVPR
ncbi:MAG: MoxR family ATPase [Clostridiales bacterium]|jgi:MoxR-like ATPase|nr:MoxR family ATPase [Clostridiales bacterium]